MRLLALAAIVGGVLAIATARPARRKRWRDMSPAEQLVFLLERDGLFLAPRQ